MWLLTKGAPPTRCQGSCVATAGGGSACRGIHRATRPAAPSSLAVVAQGAGSYPTGPRLRPLQTRHIARCIACASLPRGCCCILARDQPFLVGLGRGASIRRRLLVISSYGGRMDTSSVGFQIAIVLFAALAGAVAQNYLLPGKRTSKSNFDLSHATFKKSKVVIGDTTLNVRQDNRVYVTIDAATRIASETSADEDDAARRRRKEAAHRKRLKELETAGRPKKDENENDLVILAMYGLLGLGVIAVAATFYVKYRNVVATILGS